MYVVTVAAIPDSVRTVLQGPGLAHLVTLEPDGRPQVSIVWVGLDGDEIVAAHLPEHRKLRNMRRDPRVALSIEAGTRNRMGLNEYVVIHGRARITEGGAAELLQAAGAHLSGARGEVPAHGRSAARLHHAHRGRSDRRCRPVGRWPRLIAPARPTRPRQTCKTRR